MAEAKQPAGSLTKAAGAHPPRRFSNREAQERWSGPVTTQSGLKVFVRPARSGDRAALERFFARLTQEGLYFRFLSGLRRIDEDRLEAMLCDTDDHSIDLLALDVDTGEVLAAAMLAADATFETAEFALSTRPDVRGKGISWALLELAARYAAAMGVGRLQSLQSAAQSDALQLEREMGFTVRTCADDPTLMLAELEF